MWRNPGTTEVELQMISPKYVKLLFRQLAYIASAAPKKHRYRTSFKNSQGKARSEHGCTSRGDEGKTTKGHA